MVCISVFILILVCVFIFYMQQRESFSGPLAYYPTQTIWRGKINPTQTIDGVAAGIDNQALIFYQN